VLKRIFKNYKVQASKVLYLELKDIHDPKEFERVRLAIEAAHRLAIKTK
jgi:hypothetical protein